MHLSHTRPVKAAACDDRNLLSSAGLVPALGLAHRCGLEALATKHVSMPTDKGAHAGQKVFALVAGMVAGADSIDDPAVLRHGAMPTVFDRPYAPSTLGSFLRSFTFGHVRQLDAVATRFMCGLAPLNILSLHDWHARRGIPDPWTRYLGEAAPKRTPRRRPRINRANKGHTESSSTTPPGR